VHLPLHERHLSFPAENPMTAYIGLESSERMANEFFQSSIKLISVVSEEKTLGLDSLNNFYIILFCENHSEKRLVK
jgi:hypothetical protein